MTIRAVFRVQCDGPCGGWLSESGEVAAQYGTPTVRVTAMFPGERAARTAAQNAGWDVLRTSPVKVWCPKCRENPLGIHLPRQCRTCTHVHRGRAVCGHAMTGYPCMCMNEVTG